MTADELLLAGLIHDIGIIPVITYIEKTGLEISNEKEIKELMQSLNVVTHAEDWIYDSGEGHNIENAVIVAQVYDKMRRKQHDNLPDISEIPALKNLLSVNHDSDFVMQILDEAKDEITEMKGLLGL
ncbi:hypothetical protein MNBD_GAMMA07-2651 [hydrothermal vent metagenome]|uniref:HDOD domain-containing protein n=1 Tax=hydrothermal vent metagenome TaxID=652676 RepID=A0A3B0WY02_9ZZZZ